MTAVYSDTIQVMAKNMESLLCEDFHLVVFICRKKAKTKTFLEAEHSGFEKHTLAFFSYQVDERIIESPCN